MRIRNPGFFYVLYSTLLHLPPLSFHCVGGCWMLGQLRPTALAVRRSNRSATSHPHLAQRRFVHEKTEMCGGGGYTYVGFLKMESYRSFVRPAKGS
jgi:hypothetical protein